MDPDTYPLTLRRLRGSPQIRALTREVRLHPDQFIQPLFVAEGISAPEPVSGLGYTRRDTPDSLLAQVEADLERGVKSFLLFGVPGTKSERGFTAEFTAQQIRAVKDRFGAAVFLATDVCVCSHTSHGHCGVLSPEGDRLLNDESVTELARLAADYAQAGADCVAPSDMMDGRIAAIRAELARRGSDRTIVMSYAAKFHSRFYGPFRAAADSAPKAAAGSRLNDRATYQIDPARPADALASAERDAAEGADILMVKPGLPYLDIIQRIGAQIPALPLAAYEVSGEYAALEFLGKERLIDPARGHVEAWTALARAGAQILISYGARHAREWLQSAEGNVP